MNVEEEEMSSRMDELKGNLSAEKGRIARQQIEMKGLKAAEFSDSTIGYHHSIVKRR